MPISIKLTQFDGPFDLLLSLIQDNKLNISELSLSTITEQYLAYLAELDDSKAEELADFLVIAARLLLLKSSKLLPQFAPVEDEGPTLEDQLKLYKSFLEASKKINERWLEGKFGAFRTEPPRRSEQFTPPTNLTLEKLRQSMLQLVNRLKPLKPIPQAQIDRAVSMKEKIDHIRQLLKSSKTFSFSDLLSSGKNRTEVIVSFLALLELVKLKMVGLEQGGSFGEIVVRKVN